MIFMKLQQPRTADRLMVPMLSDEHIQQLRDLGFDTATKHGKRLLDTLGAMFSLQEDGTRPLKLREIHERLAKMTPESVPSKSLLRQDLKILIENNVVRVEDPNAARPRYIIDVNTVAEAISHVQENVEEMLEEEKERILERIERVRNIDSERLAESLLQEITGRSYKATTRFAKGVEEMHLLIFSNIIRPSRKGDVIRASAMFVETLVEGSIERMQKYFEAARKGVEIRYMVNLDVLKSLENREQAMNPELLKQFFQMQVKLNKEEAGRLYIRVTTEPKTYNHVSLNHDRSALILTEAPVTTTYFTREFNADLIDNIVEIFDDLWERAIPLEQIVTSGALEMGLTEDNPVLVALPKKRERENAE